MMSLALPTFRAIDCRPAYERLAIAGLFAPKWNRVLGSGMFGVTGLNKISFSQLFVSLQGLLNRDQIIRHDQSGKYRRSPIPI